MSESESNVAFASYSIGLQPIFRANRFQLYRVSAACFPCCTIFKTINIANVVCSLSFLTGKMPFSVIQHRRRRLALVMMVHLFNLQVRSLWIHLINNLRFEKGEFFLLYPDLRKYEDKFFGWYRMSTRQFDHLLSVVKNSLRKKCTNFREPISPEEQLVITIT